MIETIKTPMFIICLLISIIPCISCDGWIENRAVMTQAPENEDISPDLVRANIETTDFTAIVYILKGRVEGRPILRRLGGYVNHIFQARVLETIRGTRYETISFSVMAESDLNPYMPDHPVIVSLCGSGSNKFYVPDNGYELPATASLTAAARERVRKLKKSAPRKSVCSE